MGQREEEIAKLEYELADVIPSYIEMERRVNEIKGRIASLKKRVEVGDHVEWYETCRRGCCLEDKGHGVVDSIHEMFAFVRMSDGMFQKKPLHTLTRVG